MKKHTPILIVLIVVALVAGIILVATRRSPSVREQQAAKSKTEEPRSTALTVKGASIEQKDSAGQLEWRVTAGGNFALDKDREVATGKKVTFEIIQAGKAPLTVTAPTFEADYGAKKLTFTEGVEGVVTDGSSRFRTTRLVYDFDTKKLQGTGGVTFVHQQYTASAQEIVVDPAHKKMRLRGGVKFARSS